MSSVPHTGMDSFLAIQEGQDDVLYQNERTLVLHVSRVDGKGLVCKKPIGAKAGARLRHERRILERLADVPGVLRPLAEQPSVDAIAFEDRDAITLTQAMRDQRMDLTAQIALMLQLADILAGVHRAGVVHKDISPGNILLCGAERKPLLIDFDLATTFAEERPGFIQPQEIAGTLAYIAPEQTGRSGRAVDQRADLYALGAVCYELIVGRPPFNEHHDDPLQLVYNILVRVPVAPAELDPRVPKALSDILLRLLEKEPDRRYQSAEGLKADILRLREMLARGDSAPFPLGEFDYPLRLVPPSRLVGRGAEIGMLQAAFDNAMHGRGSGVLVSGAPGVGKSALINELRPIVTARRGRFVSGKFDQFRQDTASDVVVQMLRSMFRLMLAEPEAELNAMRERMSCELGSNLGLMAGLVPECAAFFAVEPEVDDGDPIQRLKRLIQAALAFVRASASQQKPLAMVIDDLQWASTAVLDFIDAIMADDGLRGFLLLASYRDQEVNETHPLSSLLARWERMDGAPMHLHLDNLAQDDLAKLLAEMLHLPAPRADELAQMIRIHTAGNPFDTTELVNALRHDGILVLGAKGWQWDAAAIQRYVGKGEVVDLLAARIARLPMQARSLLEIMACLGNEVETTLLAVAGAMSTVELEEGLAAALEDGLLTADGGDKLRFRHDRVQQVVYGGLAREARAALHLSIARRLAAQPGDTHVGYRMTAAEQYLAAGGGIDDDEERRHVVDLFHAAATHARNISSNPAAEGFLTAALALLDKVRERPDVPAGAASSLRTTLEIDLHSTLYSLGRFDEADVVYGRIAGRCLDPAILAGPGGIQVNSLTNRGRPQDAVTIGLDLLRKLGHAPLERRDSDIAMQLDQLSQWAKRPARANDKARNTGGGQRVAAASELINRLMAPASFSDMKVMLWLSLESQRLWDEHGPSAALVASLSCTCLVFVTLSQDYRGGYEIVKHVITVGEAHGYEPETSQAMFLFAAGAAHWFEPFEDSIVKTRRAHEGLVRGGDLQMDCWNRYQLLAATLDCLPSIDTCAAETDSALGFGQRVGNGYAVAAYLAFRQLLRALHGETVTVGGFNDGDFDEATYLSGLTGNPLAAGYFHFYRALSAAIFDEDTDHARHAAAAMQMLPGFCYHYIAALTRFLQALALLKRIRTAQSRERETLFAEFDECRDWLERRAADAPMNFRHLCRWLEAERAWAGDDFNSALTAFDAALDEVAAHQRPWHQALMTERAGMLHLAHGLQHSGRMLLAEARQLYAAWGAGAKVEQMTMRHDFLRKTQNRRRNDRTSSNSSNSLVSASSLDLLAILRASQALSSETNLTSLKARLGELLRELAGATHISGAVWYQDHQEWRVTPPENTEPIPVEAAGQRGLLPLSAFNYVVRTREPLLVADALQDDRFARDPYFAGIASSSLLGVPIFNQGVLNIVLLMENRLSHGAFTTDRLDAVNLIAGQLAISINNALLYDSLERKVKERTQALEEANKRLAALSTTDALTGLANRRRFNEVFEAEWQRAIRPRIPLGVAMIDVDQFKLYNDHYGHQCGDECLRRVAAALRESVRGDADLVARYGGEEFVIVLPGSNLAATCAVAERARAAVEALNEAHEKATHGIVTVSVGVAAMVPETERETGQLLELADAALYRAKKNGRNQVVGWREN